MTQFLFFIFVLMIFLSPFLVEMEKTHVRCITADDCPKVERPLKMKCIGNYCHYFLNNF
ncbi:putative Late nodulin [Medicago truncatula]|uniref:Nodule Cysteine-Rich (NCR) secreted peptide n=1 Tax=Medicago truncatula TaxID=3880 RepID=G7KPK3_MEDTR|nr:Nodule Cysteine-Rich (NCR) secreted peptide [Medicago truncatula]RHN50713.1 putative Late nodulin [Medicago truncatula]